MSKNAKKWLIAAASLTAAGLIIFAAVMTVYHWDFSRLSTDKYETNTYEIRETFGDIKLNTDTADILFAASSDNACRVVCHENEKIKHSVSVQDGTLTVTAADGRNWYDHIAFGFHSPKITVYLPKAEYASLTVKGSTGTVEIPEDFGFQCADISLSTGDARLSASVSGSVKISLTTGDIEICGISAGALDLSVSTGEIAVSDTSCEGDINAVVTTGGVKLAKVTCRDLFSRGTTGDVFLKDVVAAGKLSLERSTGDVRLEGSDAGELEISTDTGNVTGSLLSSKVFIAHSDTGKVDVPETTSGGKCKITTDTGDIKIEIR